MYFQYHWFPFISIVKYVSLISSNLFNNFKEGIPIIIVIIPGINVHIISKVELEELYLLL